MGNQAPPIILRPMVADDIPAVMKIERVSYATPWDEIVYRQSLTTDHAYFDVAVYQNHIIGYTGMWNFVDEVHLGTIVSHPAVRGKGIGELLLVNVIGHAHTLKAETVTLEVRPSNHPARALYEKYYFKEVGYRKKYYGGKEDAIIMTTPTLDGVEFQHTFQHLTGILMRQLKDFSVNLLTL